MLDVEAELLGPGSTLLLGASESRARHAELELELEPGPHLLIVRGGAEGSPERGFSSYASLGFYAIDEEKVQGLTDCIVGNS